MNDQVTAIAGRMSLRSPQRRALEILDRVTEIVPLKKGGNVETALATIQSEFPSLTDFEREFPSLCFALATGVGKTRLMGAFITYLHLAHGNNNFFVLAPNLTIFKKLVADFTPGTPKYVFRGIAEFATAPPEIITGDNYEQRVGTMFDELVRCKVNIFNISKINSEIRGGKSPRIKRLSEYIGESYFDYLAGLPDLVLLMDESHRYRASAGIRAINELRPTMGLELTATPFIETSRGSQQFKNVVYDYPLGKAMEDGFVKEPAVVTRKNFNPAGMPPDEIELLKLKDGVRLHEQTKVVLETYARENNADIVKPFLLVIARDTTHASQLVELIQQDSFFDGRYKEKVIQVDSSRTGAAEDEMVERLLRVEHTDEPTEIVIHVNMLKEGWDVTNLYTIVPLRAANARILIEQSIGRGLRLPYGKRTGVAEVDRLSIIGHDKFQEIIDEANRPESLIRLQAIVLDPDDFGKKTKTIVSQPLVANQLGIQPTNATEFTELAGRDQPKAFQAPADQQIALLAYAAIRRLGSKPSDVPSLEYVTSPEVQTKLVQEVSEQYRPEQLELPGVTAPDIAAVVARTAELFATGVISIPRILVAPKGEVRSGFNPFELELSTLNYQPPDEELWLQYLRTGMTETVGLGRGSIDEARLEDYVVRGLVDFDDIAYDSHADLLYELATQVVQHFGAYLSDEETRKVLQFHQRDIATFIHVQMQDHYWEDAVEQEVQVRKGFTELRDSAYTMVDGESVLDLHHSPSDKSNMAKYLFGGFTRCLYTVQKFHSDPERILAVILDRESEKWFKPAKGQFQIFYKSGSDHLEYQPDFVAETTDGIFMLESKARSNMSDPDVLAKRDAAVTWCTRATEYAASHGGKPWQYALIPHDIIKENMTISGLVSLET